MAGGRSSRMGMDKSKLMLNGRTLLNHAIDRLGIQVSALAININGKQDALSYPVITDDILGYAGPLAGVRAALHWAARLSLNVEAVVTVPVDAPFFPLSLVEELTAGGAECISVARCADQLHPLFALWPISTAKPLQEWLRDDSNRSAKRFISSVPHKVVEFPFNEDLDPFMNLNTPADIVNAEMRIQKS